MSVYTLWALGALGMMGISALAGEFCGVMAWGCALLVIFELDNWNEV